MENVIIAGSGPAGYTAAIYTARAGLSPLMFAGEIHGGQLMITTDVENYPGFPQGVKGPELMDLFRKQAERFGTRIYNENVIKIDLASRPFKLWTHDKTYESRALIISTGASSKWLGLESEQKLIGRGVSSCATCDGYFFKDQDVVVVGGGDSAIEEALFLTKLVRHVTIIHRRDQLRASKIMQQRAFSNPKVSFIFDSVITEILDPELGKVTSVRIKNLKTQQETFIPCSAVFIAIGHKPNTEIFKGQIEMDELGYIITHKGTHTSVPGVFACGDVQDPLYRQAITAAGSGCMAALDCERWLQSEPRHQ